MMNTQPKMIRMTQRIVVTLGLILIALPGTILAVEWEIEPQDDPRVQFGRISVVGGALGTEPILFVLKNITLSTPVQVTLAATDAHQPVDMSVYKDSPSKPLLSGTATTDKALTFRFKTGETVYFAVHGANGAHYQLFTWVWPEVQIEDADPVIPVSEYPASPPRVEKSSSPSVETSSTPNTRSGVALVLGIWPTIFLGLILLALIAIIVLLWRRGSKTGAAVLLLSIFVQTSFAQQQKGIPGKIAPKDEAPAVKHDVGDVIKIADKLSKAGESSGGDTGVYKPTKMEPGVGFVTDKSKDITYTIRVQKEATEKPNSIKYTKIIGDAAGLTKFTLGLLEQFGFIDPREAAIQRNMNPPGMPLLPSRCAKNPECRRCLKQATDALTNAHSLLEEQYVIYKQTELAAGRIIELADAAAGLSPYAKLVWTVQKDGEDINKAKAALYTTYDTNLAKLLSMLNDALIAQGACERDAFGDQDWYNRYGMIYYTFMRERYTRK
jgi:hypothetical protein